MFRFAYAADLALSEARATTANHHPHDHNKPCLPYYVAAHSFVSTIFEYVDLQMVRNDPIILCALLAGAINAILFDSTATIALFS